MALDRETTTLQALVNEAPTAVQYDSDAWVGYGGVVYYPGHYTGLPNKTQTYSVEAGNAADTIFFLVLSQLFRHRQQYQRCV